jgi:hypothetical protein
MNYQLNQATFEFSVNTARTGALLSNERFKLAQQEFYSKVEELTKVINSPFPGGRAQSVIGKKVADLHDYFSSMLRLMKEF